jgi:hypothetical protein
MVQKSKGGKKSRSVLAGKKNKMEMKYHRKDNYKKKKTKRIECCVCMEEIDDIRDNVVTCGKVNHPLCGTCKLKCKDCPMCRSHSVKPPVDQSVRMKILQSSSKVQDEYPKKKIYVSVGSHKVGRSTYGVEPPLTQFSGVYHEIRRNKFNYPIYKKLDQEKYIVQEMVEGALEGEEYKKNVCQWVFCTSPDNDYEWYSMYKEGKLIGNHRWRATQGRSVQLTIRRVHTIRRPSQKVMVKYVGDMVQED